MNSNSLLKGTLQPIILKLLSEHDKMYGYQITQIVRNITSGEIILTEGALYPALHKLESEGVLQTHLETVDGRSRKYYSLTCEGKKQVMVSLKETKGFLENLQLLLKLNLSNA